jgi:hypothetical protein
MSIANEKKIWEEVQGELTLTVLRLTFTAKDHHLCGYVSGAPELLSRIEPYDLLCHGGVTFASLDRAGYVALDQFVIGFDCAHSGDTPEKCNLEYVQAECRSLAEQIRAQFAPRLETEKPSAEYLSVPITMLDPDTVAELLNECIAVIGLGEPTETLLQYKEALDAAMEQVLIASAGGEVE